MRSPAFLTALLVGLLIRLAALQLPVTVDVATRTSPLSIAYDGGTAASPGGWHSNALIKLPGLMCAAALTVLLYRVTASRTGSVNHARWAALAVWLNPALILNGEALGLGRSTGDAAGGDGAALAHRGAPLAAGVFGGVAAGLSPDGALVLPAARRCGALARAAAGPDAGRRRRVLVAAASRSRRWRSAADGHTRLTACATFYLRGDMLSAYAANLWWILSWAHGVRRLVPQAKPLVALRVMTEPVAVPKSLTIAGPQSRCFTRR